MVEEAESESDLASGLGSSDHETERVFLWSGDPVSVFEAENPRAEVLNC